MQSTFINTAATAGPQFDSPPIAAAPQMAPAPFSQLLIQAQTPPIPSPPPPPPSPPPAPPKANNTPRTNGGSDSGPNNSQSQAPATNQSNNNNSPSNASPSNNKNNTSGANQQATGAGKTQAEPRPKPGGKGPQAPKAGDDNASQQTTAQSSAESAATAATVLSTQAGKKGDTGKDQKDDAKTGDTKTDDASQSSGDASATTPDAGAQAAAAESAIATATPPVQDNQTGKAKTDAKQTVKPGATPANGKGLPVAGLVPTATQQAAGGALPADAAATTTNAPSHTKGDATQTGSIPTTKNAPPIASPNNNPPAPSDASANMPTAANVVTTVAASDIPVISTTTVDASTTTAVPPPVENASPPQAAATPNYAAQNNALSTTPSAFAATMTQAGAAANSAGSGNTIDRARFVQRVASAFQSAGDQGGQIRLRLSPPELGSLQMQISVKQGVLSATIQADNSTARQALLDSLPDLRDRLAQQDIRIDRFDVELMGQGSGGMPQPQGNPDFNQSGRQPPAVRNTSTAPAVESGSAPVNLAVATNGALNIVV